MINLIMSKFSDLYCFHFIGKHKSSHFYDFSMTVLLTIFSLYLFKIWEMPYQQFLFYIIISFPIIFITMSSFFSFFLELTH